MEIGPIARLLKEHQDKKAKSYEDTAKDLDNISNEEAIELANIVGHLSETKMLKHPEVVLFRNEMLAKQGREIASFIKSKRQYDIIPIFWTSWIKIYNYLTSQGYVIDL